MQAAGLLVTQNWEGPGEPPQKQTCIHQPIHQHTALDTASTQSSTLHWHSARHCIDTEFDTASTQSSTLPRHRARHCIDTELDTASTLRSTLHRLRAQHCIDTAFNTASTQSSTLHRHSARHCIDTELDTASTQSSTLLRHSTRHWRYRSRHSARHCIDTELETADTELNTELITASTQRSTLHRHSAQQCIDIALNTAFTHTVRCKKLGTPGVIVFYNKSAGDWKQTWTVMVQLSLGPKRMTHYDDWIWCVPYASHRQPVGEDWNSQVHHHIGLVPLEEAYCAYSAFRSLQGVFQFMVMPFGAPVKFQRLMDRVLQRWEDCSAAYSGSNNYLIPCWFCRFVHLQTMELCIILIIGAL